MNILEFLKNGSGIHIKKKNRGKFTSYCGGKVTDECIRKAKASGNPTLVKRATFADNARRFKHKEGGIIKSQEGSKLTKALNSDIGKGLTNLVIQGGAELWKSNQANSFSENFDKATDSQAKLMKKKSWGEKYNEALKFAPQYFQQNAQDGVHYGVIDYQEFAKSYADSNIDLDSIEQFKYEREQQKQNQLNAIQGNSSVSDILQKGLGLVGDYLSNKSTKESTTNTGTTNVGTTNVKTNSLGNDFSSGYNQFTKNSVLYNPDKFWNL